MSGRETRASGVVELGRRLAVVEGEEPAEVRLSAEVLVDVDLSGGGHPSIGWAGVSSLCVIVPDAEFRASRIDLTVDEARLVLELLESARRDGIL